MGRYTALHCMNDVKALVDKIASEITFHIHLTFQVKSSAGAVGRTVKASKPINFGNETEDDSSDEEEVRYSNM